MGREIRFYVCVCVYIYIYIYIYTHTHPQLSIFKSVWQRTIRVTMIVFSLALSVYYVLLTGGQRRLKHVGDKA